MKIFSCRPSNSYFRASRNMLILLLPATFACSSATGSVAGSQAASPRLTPAEVARRDGGIAPYTAADVNFMAGMIGHHAQAVLIARWAPSHGASPSLQILAERIAISQLDEIAFMQSWLRERKEEVPSGEVSFPDHSSHAQHGAHGSHDHSSMPGMLSNEELEELNNSRGVDFDRLFLTFMIKHHEGALVMVEELLSNVGAAQDDDVYRFVADVNADQATEINRMQLMLKELPSEID